MNKKKENVGGVKAYKMTVGEKVEFDTFIKTKCDTRFGEATVIKFVKDKKITRSLFAGSGLLAFLQDNPAARSVTLVDQIPDGEMTYNIYE